MPRLARVERFNVQHIPLSYSTDVVQGPGQKSLGVASSWGVLGKIELGCLPQKLLTFAKNCSSFSGPEKPMMIAEWIAY